jgi:hypothetical protein
VQFFERFPVRLAFGNNEVSGSEDLFKVRRAQRRMGSDPVPACVDQMRQFIQPEAAGVGKRGVVDDGRLFHGEEKPAVRSDLFYFLHQENIEPDLAGVVRDIKDRFRGPYVPAQTVDPGCGQRDFQGLFQGAREIEPFKDTEIDDVAGKREPDRGSERVV